MKSLRSKTNFICACVLIFTVYAEASLFSDPAAMPGFHSETSFNISSLGSTLKADVEYAVYAPGSYGGTDPTGGSQYIYAYQIFNKLQSNVAVDFYSVGILAGANFGNVSNDPSYGVPGGLSALCFHFAQSAGYIFSQSVLNPGTFSDVLLFSSTLAPTMGFGTISGGGLGQMGSLPTPSTTPEPATISIIFGALIFLRKPRK